MNIGNFFKKNGIKVLVLTTVLSLFLITIYIISDTYASGSYTVVFNRAENTEVMKTCKTDEAGKLDSDCINTISNICSLWSLDSWNGSNNQTNQLSISELSKIVITKDTNYYCVAGSSKPNYHIGCYVCNNDNNIMKWKTDTAADDDCASGYFKSDTIKEEDKCVTVVPESCYVCKDTGKDYIMKWDNNGDSDNSCSSGYKPVDKPKNECVTVVPKACYVCKNNESVMKWDDNGNKDNNCDAGYSIVPGKTESECVPVDNPKTGNALIFFVWMIGLYALGYSVYYFRKIKSN